VRFYSSLYASEYREEEELMEGLCGELPHVSEEANEELDKPITPQELKAALQGMQGRLAPGIDGLPAEFYKEYWYIFAGDILAVFNESLASGSMPMSCRRAVLTLLPKKGNPQDIGNWRPVSLLCVDYKLVEQVIHWNQTYCVPSRSMVDNVHLIRDVLEASSSFGIDTGLISVPCPGCSLHSPSSPSSSRGFNKSMIFIRRRMPMTLLFLLGTRGMQTF